MNKISGKIQKNLLVVDDEEEIRDIILSFFLAKGYQVYLAFDGQHAITQLQTYDIDLVITDLDMPNLNGPQLIKWLKQEKPQMPIVVISGRIDELTKEIIAITVDGVLCKPFEMKELEKIVAENLV